MKLYKLSTNQMPIWNRELLTDKEDTVIYASENLVEIWEKRAKYLGKELRDTNLFAAAFPDDCIKIYSDSDIGDLELEEVTSEVGEARNLEALRKDLKQDPQLLFVRFNDGDTGVDELERFLFNN